jgi:hypothetical protein
MERRPDSAMVRERWKEGKSYYQSSLLKPPLLQKTTPRPVLVVGCKSLERTCRQNIRGIWSISQRTPCHLQIYPAIPNPAD